MLHSLVRRLPQGDISHPRYLDIVCCNVLINWLNVLQMTSQLIYYTKYCRTTTVLITMFDSLDAFIFHFSSSTISI